MIRSRALIWLVACVALACADDPGSAPSEDLVLDEPSTYPCELAIEEVAELRTSESDTTDVGLYIALTARDTYVSGGANGGFLIEWDSQGNQLRTVGQAGEGPGEFRPGAIHVFIGPGDTLYARDNSQGISVFTPSMTFLRRALNRYVMGLSGYTHYLDDGTILSSYPRTTETTVSRYVVATKAGERLRSFGPVTPEEIALGSDGIGRMTAYSGGDTFWAAPTIVVGEMYSLVQWSIDGAELRSLSRRAPWLRDSNSDAVAAGGPPGQRIVAIHSDPVGLLYVVLIAPNANWDATPDPNMSQADVTPMVDIHMDVLDPTARVLLATAVFNNPAEVPIRFFPQSDRGYTIAESLDTGLPFARILKPSLMAGTSSRSESSRCGARAAR